MTKLSFLLALNDKLSGLPHNEVEERLRFYSEMIEDRMEEGLTEEEAVAAVGDIGEIAAHITADLPVKTGEKPKTRMKAWEIVLLVLGAPIWFSLLIAAASVVFSLYVVLWSLVASAWSVFVSLISCGFAGVVFGIGMIVGKFALPGVAMIGAGMVLTGLSVFAFWGCMEATKGTVKLTALISKGIKKRFAGKEAA